MFFKKKYENYRVLTILSIVFICCISCGENLEVRFERLIADGDSIFAQREYKKALVPWREALKIHPVSVDVQKKIAQAYLRLAEFSEAETIFAKIIRDKPNAANILLELVKLQLVTGNIKDAFKNWNDLNNLHPDDPLVKVVYGDLLVLEGRFDEAENAYKKAAEISNNRHNIVLIKLAACYLSQDKVDLAEEIFTIATVNQTESIDELLQFANYWKLKNNMVNAELFIHKALSLEPEDLSLQMKLSRFYFGIQRYKDSQLVIEKLIGQAPKNKAFKKYLLKILLAQNQLDKFQLFLIENKMEMRNDPEYNLLAGKYYLVKNKLAIAEEHFKRVTRDQPNNFLAHYFLGITYLLDEHVYFAQQSFAKALSLNTSFSEAEIALADINYQNSEYDFSYEHIKRVLEKEPENFRAHMVMGNIFLANKQYEDAYFRFRAALSINPDSQSAVYYLALTSEHLNENDKALELYLKLLKKNQYLADVAWRLKELWIQTGENETAEQYFKLAVKSSPENGYLHYILGEVYLDGSATSKAIESFNSAIKILPELSSSYMKLAGIYAGQAFWEKQTDILKLCIKNVPDFLDSHFQLASVYQKKERWDDSIKVLEAALRKYPDEPLLANNLAYLYLESNQNINKAFGLARSAYEKMPNNAAAADSLGWAYYKKNFFAQAVSYLENASMLDPDNSAILEHLSLARLGMNQE